jgi:Pyruvate/2-oxoacid:ferredoxin oxidoreductase delta subunit
MKHTIDNTVRRFPVIEAPRCNICGRCIDACPRNAILEHFNVSCEKCIKYCISMDVPCSPEHIVFSYDRCDSCGLCIAACGQNAMYWFVKECDKGAALPARGAVL